ncbi:hypothetical protein VOLCADRAFT_100609 [Volvox carteri f. nagariensis]|uniref:Uncharacterized protein n=2 Tax=Volvox carteri f. nagariensis TaxID=3068 RepID=D8UKL9_VOLCA|nr:uncharacterized protein VOLCADRAFT_100609 [Volvox carteri f. nagariensis]EFJ39723.1 hypothetical protein VOLCADRAFT_100609 [Volvox carteri f. nagariensis]|eukprot:XP_002959205.1 hypothetical protein VOLCADRAFT_100609 [Volvox carteri f. nagariensis]
MDSPDAKRQRLDSSTSYNLRCRTLVTTSSIDPPDAKRQRLDTAASQSSTSTVGPPVAATDSRSVTFHVTFMAGPTETSEDRLFAGAQSRYSSFIAGVNTAGQGIVIMQIDDVILGRLESSHAFGHRVTFANMDSASLPPYITSRFAGVTVGQFKVSSATRISVEPSSAVPMLYSARLRFPAYDVGSDRARPEDKHVSDGSALLLIPHGGMFRGGPFRKFKAWVACGNGDSPDAGRVELAIRESAPDDFVAQLQAAADSSTPLYVYGAKISPSSNKAYMNSVFLSGSLVAAASAPGKRPPKRVHTFQAAVQRTTAATVPADTTDMVLAWEQRSRSALVLPSDGPHASATLSPNPTSVTVVGSLPVLPLVLTVGSRSYPVCTDSIAVMQQLPNYDEFFGSASFADNNDRMAYTAYDSFTVTGTITTKTEGSHALKLLLRQAFTLFSSVASSRRVHCIFACIVVPGAEHFHAELFLQGLHRACLYFRTAVVYPVLAVVILHVLRWVLCLIDNEGPNNTRTRRTSATGSTFRPPQLHVATTDVVPVHRPAAYAALLAAADRATMQAPRLLPFTMHSTGTTASAIHHALDSGSTVYGSPSGSKLYRVSNPIELASGRPSQQPFAVGSLPVLPLVLTIGSRSYPVCTDSIAVMQQLPNYDEFFGSASFADNNDRMAYAAYDSFTVTGTITTKTEGLGAFRALVGSTPTQVGGVPRIYTDKHASDGSALLLIPHGGMFRGGPFRKFKAWVACGNGDSPDAGRVELAIRESAPDDFVAQLQAAADSSTPLYVYGAKISPSNSKAYMNSVFLSGSLVAAASAPGKRPPKRVHTFQAAVQRTTAATVPADTTDMVLAWEQRSRSALVLPSDGPHASATLSPNPTSVTVVGSLPVLPLVLTIGSRSYPVCTDSIAVMQQLPNYDEFFGSTSFADDNDRMAYAAYDSFTVTGTITTKTEGLGAFRALVGSTPTQVGGVPRIYTAPAPPPEPPAPTAAATLDQPTSQTATELPRLAAFHGTHPLYRTHVHVRLPRPRYVQLGGSLPRRPRPGTSAAGMAQYYAFVLGTFKAHRGQPIPPGLTVKEAYDTWWAELGTTEAGRSYQAYVSVLLDNIEEDHAGKARRQAEYNQRRRQQRAAAAAAVRPEGDSTSASDGDADDGVRGHLRPDPETQPPAEDQLEHFVYIPGQEYPTAGTDLAAVALTDLFDCTNAAGVYAYDAARRCRAPALADGHGARSNRFSRRITPADLPLLTEATKRLKRYLVAAAAGTVEADGGAHTGLTATPEMDTPHVELHRPTSGPLVAIVRMPGTPERTEQARMPIYVHLPQPPSIDDTIELFTLAPHQAVPFMLMARYFDHRDEPNPGDPPQMLVEGKPSTGKSQFVQALLWYTFQHGCPHWAATCTYSWAAATAFSTPVHRSLSTHAMFALSAGSNRADSVRKGSAASLQVHRNVGDGALIIDEIGMNSLDHLGACNQSCTRHLLPPPHLAGDHPAATIFSGRPSANTGDEFQHPKPGGPPLYKYAAAVECNPQFSPSVPTAQPLHGEEDNDDDPNEAAAGSQGGQQQPEAAARRPRAVPQTQSCILEGFRVYRSLAKTVFLLEKQQRQDSSPSGRRLTEYASMFGGEPATEQRIAEMVDDLNSRAIVDLADLAHLEPRVVLQRNEPHHTLNTRLIMLEAQRKNQRLVVWNADHVPVQKRGAAAEPALTHVEKAVAMRIKDHEFGHTTADTWYYHGARYILLDTTAADAGASHNNEVEACGLLEDGREPADDGRGPYRRLKYLPAAVIVRPISGHIPGTVLQGLGDYASRGGAFILSPRASCIAEVDMPAAGYGTITKQIRRLNVPLGDRQAVTDYFVQGRSFKDECWLVDLAVPPNGIKRATLYVLLTRFKTLDHVRLLRPLYTTPHERKRIIKQFLSATNLEPDLAANLRLLKQAARETEQRYTAEFQHARQLEARWTPSARG